MDGFTEHVLKLLSNFRGMLLAVNSACFTMAAPSSVSLRPRPPSGHCAPKGVQVGMKCGRDMACGRGVHAGRSTPGVGLKTELITIWRVFGVYGGVVRGMHIVVCRFILRE